MNLASKAVTDYYRVAAGLLCNALRFRYCRLTGSPQKPSVLSLAVTNRCNSHCIMCNIWKSTGDIPEIKSLEMPGQNIIDMLSKPLFSELVELDLTGGEPHLRDDLVDIVPGIIHLKKNYLPKLRSIIITSNGFLTRRIISNYTDILSSLKGTDIDLVAVISLDGIGGVHDRIRGTPGAFKLASETIGRLLELMQKFPNLIAGIKTTILPDNVDVLDAVLDFALSRGIFHIISPVFFTAARFRNAEKRDILTLGTEEHKKLFDFYSHDELKTSYFYSLSRQFLATGKKQWACAALYNYAFIDFDGQVYPCELIPSSIGNVKTEDIQDIWYGKTARYWRSRIGKPECCRLCHEPGAIRYSAFIEGLAYLKFLAKLGRHKFNESWRGEGFSKYIKNDINRYG